MQTRLYFTVILLTLCELIYSFPQNGTDSLKVFQENKNQESLISIDSISDTEKDKKPLLTFDDTDDSPVIYGKDLEVPAFIRRQHD